MNNLFRNCYSLKSLPEKLDWDLQNLEEMSNIFNGCKLLTSLPDISKWNTKYVSNFSDYLKIVIH